MKVLIGSRHKIDASYLSPNVNLAARLESGTHQFHVDLLLSDAFVQLLSPTARGFCRQIDNVCVKGSAVPIGLYTYDLKEKSIKDDDDEEKHDSDYDIGIDNINRNDDELSDWERVYLYDYDLQTYRRNINKEFIVTFRKAFDNYIEGKWDLAKQLLDKCKKMDPDDGPTMVLLKVLAKYDNVTPKDWAGNRSLTSMFVRVILEFVIPCDYLNLAGLQLHVFNVRVSYLLYGSCLESEVRVVTVDLNIKNFY